MQGKWKWKGCFQTKESSFLILGKREVNWVDSKIFLIQKYLKRYFFVFDIGQKGIHLNCLEDFLGPKRPLRLPLVPVIPSSVPRQPDRKKTVFFYDSPDSFLLIQTLKAHATSPTLHSTQNIGHGGRGHGGH